LSRSRLTSQRLIYVALVVVASVAVSAASASMDTHSKATSVVGGSGAQSTLVDQLALARLATEKYVTDLGRAKADGYQIVTKMIPTMGYHFRNPKVKGFDIQKPPILVYEHRGTNWQLGAIEWVFTSLPKTPPLPGAKYGSFGAGCHYSDGTFITAVAQSACPAKAPGTKAGFTFWHPRLVTMHVWLWYPNPSGLYTSMNPLVTPYNQG